MAVLISMLSAFLSVTCVAAIVLLSMNGTQEDESGHRRRDPCDNVSIFTYMQDTII